MYAFALEHYRQHLCASVDVEVTNLSGQARILFPTAWSPLLIRALTWRLASWSRSLIWLERPPLAGCSPGHRTKPLGHGKRRANLTRPFHLVAVQVDRGGRDRGVAQVVPDCRQFRAARQCMGRMGVPHPVRAGLPQLLGGGRVIRLDQVRRLHENRRSRPTGACR